MRPRPRKQPAEEPPAAEKRTRGGGSDGDAMKTLMAEAKQIVLKYNQALSHADTLYYSIENDSTYGWAQTDADGKAFVSILKEVRAEVFSNGLGKAMSEPLGNLRKTMDDDGSFLTVLHKIRGLIKKIESLVAKTATVKKLHAVKVERAEAECD